MKTEYSILNGLVQGVGGFISTIGCGVLADVLEKKSLMAKSWIVIIGCLIGIPCMAGACLFRDTNFYVSLAFLGLKFLMTEGFMAPTITMMQRTVKPENQGNIVSAYLFFLTVAGCSSSVLIGYLANMFNAAANPHIFGKLVFAGSTFGYLGAIPCFWMAGKAYINHV